MYKTQGLFEIELEEFARLLQFMGPQPCSLILLTHKPICKAFIGSAATVNFITMYPATLFRSGSQAAGGLLILRSTPFKIRHK